MKRKIFTLLLSAMVVVGAFAQKPTSVVNKASVDPVIDGVVDAVWAEATPQNIVLGMTKWVDGGASIESTNVVSLGAAGETTWQGLWTDNGIYVLVIVNDDDFYPSYIVNQANNWEWDKVEVYFDCNYILEDAVGPNVGLGHYQIAPPFAASNIAGTPVTETRGEKYAFMVTDPNYIAEYFMPFSMLKDKDGTSVDRTGDIGFDVMISDRDESTNLQQRVAWANDGSKLYDAEDWVNMDNAGIITLDGAEMILIDFDGITLTGGTITEDNGTLQIVADILPVNATLKVLDWSVENGTGKAKINSDGLLTAIADGDVTVWARATDGSYEEASIVVTISGQTTTLWELNVIRNGTFAAVTEENRAAEWGGWIDAGGPAHTVVDGVTVHTPVIQANVWQYQFSQNALTALPNVDYIYSFKAWADAPRTFTTDFEDTGANGNNRYGASADPRSTSGRSDWTFDLTSEPTWYTFDVNFDQIIETTDQKVIFMLALSDVTTYIDSVLLVTAVEYDPTTSVPSNSFESSVRLYPNPIDGSNMLIVDRLPANAKVTIFDSVGRMVKEVVTTQDRADFNVSSYARGVYFVRVNNEPVLKFIK